jgi:hypothetical protein
VSPVFSGTVLADFSSVLVRRSSSCAAQIVDRIRVHHNL